MKTAHEGRELLCACGVVFFQIGVGLHDVVCNVDDGYFEGLDLLLERVVYAVGGDGVGEHGGAGEGEGGEEGGELHFG